MSYTDSTIEEGSYTVRLNITQDTFNRLKIGGHLRDGDYELIKVFIKGEQYPDNPEWVIVKEEIKRADVGQLYRRLEEIEHEERNK